jgi:hypothetical protein
MMALLEAWQGAGCCPQSVTAELPFSLYMVQFTLSLRATLMETVCTQQMAGPLSVLNPGLKAT